MATFPETPFEFMRIVRQERMKRKGVCAALGVFDGVHVGHGRILRALLNQARKRKAAPLVLTFRRHPREILSGKSFPFLFPREKSLFWIRRFGVRQVVFLPFTKSFSQKSADAFLQWLIHRWNLRGITVGENFCFGKNASGTAGMMKQKLKKHGIPVQIVPTFRMGKQAVSTTRIRKVLAKGRVEEAEKLLGKPFSFSGKVRRGSGMGKVLGFPTANFKPPAVFPLKPGVYGAQARVGGRFFPAAVNFGRRPTLNGKALLLEAHLVGFSGRLNGRHVELFFKKRLRSERRFRNCEALIRQIQKDVQRVRRMGIKRKLA